MNDQVDRRRDLLAHGPIRHIDAALHRDSDVLHVLDVLARQVGVRAVFSDWPATSTFYANCTGLD